MKSFECLGKTLRRATPTLLLVVLDKLQREGLSKKNSSNFNKYIHHVYVVVTYMQFMSGNVSKTKIVNVFVK